MLNFDAGTILKAVTRLRQLESWVNNFKESKDVKKTTPMSKNAAKVIRPHIEDMDAALAGLDTPATKMAVRELVKHLKGRKVKISYQTLADYIQDIAVTLRRELSLMKIYCLER